MQKTSFLIIAITFLVTITIPTICMELDNNKKQLVLELYLKEGQPNLNEVQIIHDKYHCERFGIDWEENSNSYGVENGFFTPHKPLQPSTPYQCFESICTPQIEKELNIKIPKSLPNSFVESLKKENRILTLKNDLPAQITVHLKCIYNNSGIQIYPINLQKRFDETENKKPSDNQSTADNNTTAHFEGTTNASVEAHQEIIDYRKQQEKARSKFKTYIAAGFTITGLITALLIYLHKNNQLNSPLSNITDFIHNLISNKNS